MMDSELPPGSCNSTGHLSTIGYHTLPGRMHHSASTPAGVDSAGGCARTPPATPNKGGKMLAVRVQMLDDSISMFQIQSKAFGKVLFEQVCRQLHLLEADYFGLEYQDLNGTRYWLDVEKPLCRQVGLSMLEPTLRFCVKFYTPDPARLEEEFTRYLFCLQVKRDLAHGCIHCNENTAALMASYIVQAECGDFVPEDYPDHTYLSGYKFFPGQDPESERRIMENHKKHIGQSPAEADMNLLETARRCELYGVKMHPAKDQENVPLNLAVAHTGVLVFQNFTKINTFSWAKIRKISFKRKKFLIKLHPESYGYHRDVVEFFFDGRNECKNFWKKCVENHGFFRCTTVPRIQRHKTRVISRGSSFRYSGKTQKQIVEYVRDNYVKRQAFQRSGSFRSSRSLRSSRVNMNTPINSSVSAHPLLPLPPGSDAISLEWEKQPHYLEASLMMEGYSAEQARVAVTRPRVRRPPSVTPAAARLRDKLTKMYCSELTPGPEVVTHAEVNHHPMEDSPLPHRTKTQLISPENTWIRASTQWDTSESAADHIPQYRVPGHASDADTSPEEDTTMSSASILLSPRVEAAPSDTTSRGGDDVDNAAITTVNGNCDNSNINTINGNGNVVSESTNSIDVLSGGESDAYDTIRRSHQNNNSISPSLPTLSRKKRATGDLAYCIAKHLLMTERTYKRDLQLITVSWSARVSSLGESGAVTAGVTTILGRVCLMLGPVAILQGAGLGRLERALASDAPDGADYKNVPEIYLDYLTSAADTYATYISSAGALTALTESGRRGAGVGEGAVVAAQFERAAPLSLATLTLRPLHRCVAWRSLVGELSQITTPAIAKRLEEVTQPLTQLAEEQLRHAENHAALCQLQRDIVGYDKLLVPDREFVRLGCVYKHSSKGLQQRMLFLFSDVLLCASKVSGGYQFKVHNVLAVHDLKMEPSELPHSFSIVDGSGTSLLLNASNEDEYEGWRDSLEDTIESAKANPTQVDTELTEYDQDESPIATPPSGALPHVCWHRVTSLTREHMHLAMKSQLSGYLLRKFKNSHGWQKLWVVFAVFSLYFYKSWQDESALASLPLLGYSVCAPSESDKIQKEYVFKLQYKSHVYFFRADSQYTYNKWVEALQTTMVHNRNNKTCE